MLNRQNVCFLCDDRWLETVTSRCVRTDVQKDEEPVSRVCERLRYEQSERGELGLVNAATGHRPTFRRARARDDATEPRHERCCTAPPAGSHRNSTD